jgi:uncharacterized membrane protein YedE/YeeE
LIAILRDPRLRPYFVGIGIGVLSWATFYFMDKAIGTSTPFVGAAESVVAVAAPDHVSKNAYLHKLYRDKTGGIKPIFNWEAALDLALIAGSFLAARIGGGIGRERVPSVWAERFGPSVGKRSLAAFIGGFLLLFGARMAGGCTSGHGISGGLQLAVSSWTFFVSMFVSGVATAAILFGIRRRGEGAQ